MADVTINDLTAQAPTTNDLFPFATAVSPSTYKTSLAQIKTALAIPAAQIQSDWSQTNTGALDYIKSKPTIPSVDSSQLIKAWAVISVLSNPVTVLKSYNVTSVNYSYDGYITLTINFTNAMADLNFVTLISTNFGGNPPDAQCTNQQVIKPTSTSSVTIKLGYGPSRSVSNYVSVAIIN
jgi:hypothetical protein